MRQIIDMVGKKFGHWTVLKRDGTNKHGKVTWMCACKCGKNVVVVGSSLRNGCTQSCGCFYKERFIKHGHARKGKCSNEYVTWAGMMRRCYNPNDPSFVNYGERGIKVCDRWRGANGFKNFYADMGKRPTPRHTLDRIKNDKGYNKKNCRWATRAVQNLNQRMRLDNTSGTTGVSYDKKSRKFRSRISINNKRIDLGFFEKFDDAVSARRVAEEKYYKPILEGAK